MIAESYKIVLLGLAAIGGGIFVLTRRESLAEANAKVMEGKSYWTRVNYSKDYFRFMNSVGGIFGILAGSLCLLSVAFPRDSESAIGRYLFYTIGAFVFGGVLAAIFYAHFRFGNKK